MDKRMIDFIEAKAQRNGELTPLAVAESVRRYLQQDETVDRIAIVVRHTDGRINTAYSTMSYLELVGLHATAQAMGIESMDEPEY